MHKVNPVEGLLFNWVSNQLSFGHSECVAASENDQSFSAVLVEFIKWNDGLLDSRALFRVPVGDVV